MKKISAFAVALAAVLMAPLAAHADTTPGWYVGAGVGGTFTPDGTTHSSSGNSKLSYDPGWNLNGNAGYALSNGLRFEGEVFHSRADIDSVSPAANSTGHLSNTDLFANTYYDFHTGTMWTPYIGAGAGIAFVDANHIGTLTNGGQLESNTTEFAYQAIGGVAAQLDPNWAVTADYRYIGTTDPAFRTTAAGFSTQRTDNESHNVIVGLRYSFGGGYAPVQPTEAPARPMAHAAAKPVVAPVPQSYMVFFDFNKSDITPEAKRILASAAEDFKNGGIVKIVVTGHTDTVGTAAYNQKLSERRAAAVKTELASQGVNAQVVQTAGDGKKGLLVPTADGVREAQNRRAEIVFDKQ